MTDSNTYCLFCRSGQEGHVIQRLSDMGYATLAPRVKHWKGGQGNGASGERRLLLPGYVFFERDPSSGLPEGADPDWNSIRRISGVIRILEYQNGQRALRDSDLSFVRWLRSLGSMVEMSLAIRVGTKVNFITGPLREMQGQVVSVNTKRKVAAVRFGGGDSLFKTVWCSFDYVESNISNSEDLLIMNSSENSSK
jgi:transcription antitermination factor NusG